MTELHDPVGLTQALLRRASVTPEDDGAQALLAGWLEALGFRVTHLRFGSTPNLYAELGAGSPHLCFAGHTDVVPAGEGWAAAPFGGQLRDGVLIGRGATDMKGAIACFVAAVTTHLSAGTTCGTISLLITGDEEGPANDGTVRVLDWMADRGIRPDFCVVGEPTNPARLGEVVKVGRRGSLNATITVLGTQGHSAYPQRADNPTHRLVRILHDLIAAPLDAGTAWFEPSSLQITSIDVGNPATNVIPARATARLNMRFNDGHSGASLTEWLRGRIGRFAERFELEVAVSGESFLTEPGPAVQTLCDAISGVTGITPRLDTGGGTSDARFIARHFPVAEFGLVGATMHQTDERVPVTELHALTAIYRALLAGFLG